MASYRCITLRRTGGLTAMRLEVEVDLRASGEAGPLADLLRDLDVEALARQERAGPPAPPMPDAYRYDLTFVGGDGRTELAFGAGAGAVPPELRPVIKDLERRALEGLRARRGG